MTPHFFTLLSQPFGEHNKDLTATQQVATPKEFQKEIPSLNPDIKYSKIKVL
jgi:hypothetical protein